MNDLELLNQYETGASESAFAAIVKRYTPLVYSSARRRVGVDLTASCLSLGMPTAQQPGVSAGAALLAQGVVQAPLLSQIKTAALTGVLKEFLAEYDELVRKSPVEPDVELTIKHGTGADSRFVTKGHLNWVSLKQGIAVADLLEGWRQGNVQSGDQLLF